MATSELSQVMAAGEHRPDHGAADLLNKVPAATLAFWAIKIMSTTVGETAADYLNMDLGFGLQVTTLLSGLLLAGALFLQMRARSYRPALYWSTVVLISVFGTLVTDCLTDVWQVPLAVSSGVFAALLVGSFAAWHRREGTLSIAAIDTPQREAWYWLSIGLTFALGTAVGDWVSEGLGMGYAGGVMLFGVLLALTTIARFGLRANAVPAFWVAYVLTRPFGASIGDLLSQPHDAGGMALGTTGTSVVFLALIVAMVGWQVVQRQRIGAFAASSEVQR